MRYARIEGDELILFRGAKLVSEGRVFVHPTRETLRRAGYLPVSECEPPTVGENEVAVASYRAAEGEILTEWTVLPVDNGYGRERR